MQHPAVPLPEIVLKPGKADSAYWGHPWIYSGALARVPGGLSNGNLVRVLDHKARFLGLGSWSGTSQIAVRLFTREDTAADGPWLAGRIQAAFSRRALSGYGPDTLTTGYRMVHGEADGLPGLVLDRYGDVFVLQSSTAGMDALKPLVLQALEELFSPAAVVERSDLPSRKEEGLGPAGGLLAGGLDGPAPFLENGLRFAADTLEGQKTGFYLDQKDLRMFVRGHARTRRVLNLFSNTGSFAVYALAGGAAHVHNVDTSQPALDICPEFLRANGLSPSRATSERADVFTWLAAPPPGLWDMVILDPPAIVKSRKDKEAGRRAYHFLNRAALRLVAPGGIFVTSSCSRHLPWEDFIHMLRRAAAQSGRVLHLLCRTGQSADHPVSLYFPESEYLKSVAGVAE
jgi:23S rRNA (cytosine1962-C5)-methyltransferase